MSLWNLYLLGLDLSRLFQNALLASVGAVVVTAIIQWRRSVSSYISTWNVVMIELWHALDRVQYTEEQLSLVPAKFPSYQVQLSDGLEASFFNRVRHRDVAERVYRIYNNLSHFRNCYARGRELLITAEITGPPDSPTAQPLYQQALVWFGGSLWVARARHEGMREDFEHCRLKYNRFCRLRLFFKSVLAPAALKSVPSERREQEGMPHAEDRFAAEYAASRPHDA